MLGLKLNHVSKRGHRCVGFISLSNNENLSFLMTNTDPYILVWLGKCIYQIVIKRNEMIQTLLNRLLGPEPYVMFLSHNYENVSIDILPE